MLVSAVFCLWGLSWGLANLSVLWEGIQGETQIVLMALAKPLSELGSFAISTALSLIQNSPMIVWYGVGTMAAIGYLMTVGTGAFLCRIVQLQNAR